MEVRPDDQTERIAIRTKLKQFRFWPTRKLSPANNEATYLRDEVRAHTTIDKSPQVNTLLEIKEPRSLKTNRPKLSGRLIKVQDQERRRIARDLHDSMGQSVALLKMTLHRLGTLAGQSPEQAELLSQSVALVDTMTTELRTISYLLHPPLLDEVGLVSALRELADGFSQRSGIEASLQIDDKFGRLPGELEISIYRIVQECLTNIHRHSGSPSARILIERSRAAIHVEIQDHGRGMAVGKNRTRSGVGLAGMRERATQFGGTLEVRSRGEGTTVIARLPLSNGSAETEAAAGS